MQITKAHEDYIQWLNVARNLSRHTLLAYASDLRLIEHQLGTSASIDALSSESIFDFLERQKKSGLSATTIRRRACAIRGFCTWLAAERVVDSNPWDGIRLNLRRARTLPRPIPRHDLHRLLTYLSGRAELPPVQSTDITLSRPVEATTLLSVVLMVATGMRACEIVAITDHDLDLPRRQLLVHGKGARERQVYLPNTWVATLAGSYLHLKRRLHVNQAQLLFNRSGKSLTTAALRGRVSLASIDAGLARRVTPHMLRHTAATELVEAGVDIRYVQRLLGHASLSTTEIYTHVADHALRRRVTEADVLGRALEPQ